MRRELDNSGTMESMDRFDLAAYDMVSAAGARKAFDLSPKTRPRATATAAPIWGQSTLLARRLVEAGTTFVTVHLGGWDHHWDLKKGMENHLPQVDMAFSSLITDLADRGLLDSTLVMICGEFSRTPR